MPSVAILKGIQVDITKVRKDEFSLLPNANHPKIAEWLEGLEQWRKDVQQGIISYQALPLSEQEKRSFNVFKDTWNSYIFETKQYNAFWLKEMLKSNEVVLSSFATYAKALASLDDTLSLNDELINRIKADVLSESQATQFSAGVGSLVIIAMIIVSHLCCYLERSVNL